jgi:hypothetical protein
MLMGALVGGITAAILWMIFAVMAKGTPSTKALGPNPAIRESIEVNLSPSQVLERLRQVNHKSYTVEASSTADAIILRRNTDSATMGYAFLIRTLPIDDSRTTLHLSVAPLSNIVKQVVPKHWADYLAFLDTTLR